MIRYDPFSTRIFFFYKRKSNTLFCSQTPHNICILKAICIWNSYIEFHMMSFTVTNKSIKINSCLSRTLQPMVVACRIPSSISSSRAIWPAFCTSSVSNLNLFACQSLHFDFWLFWYFFPQSRMGVLHGVFNWRELVLFFIFFFFLQRDLFLLIADVLQKKNMIFFVSSHHCQFHFTNSIDDQIHWVNSVRREVMPNNWYIHLVGGQAHGPPIDIDGRFDFASVTSDILCCFSSRMPCCHNAYIFPMSEWGEKQKKKRE